MPEQLHVTSKGTGAKIPGISDRHVGVTPGILRVEAEAKGLNVPEEAYMALPERVVLAAYASAAVPAAKARSTPMGERMTSSDADLPFLKAEAARHRAKWILGSGSRIDAQLSFVGRALPPGSRDARRSALITHRADLTSTFETGLSEMNRARSFASSWAKKRMAKASQSLGRPSWPSPSSCLEWGASKGGTLQFLLDTCAWDDLPSDTPLNQAGASAALEARFVQYALRKLDEPGLPTHRVTCLSERGLKTRVVTVGPAWCQLLGHAVRKRLLRGLRATHTAFAPLSGASDEQIARIFEGGHAETLVSTDLTRATDLLPHDLLGAIVDGLEDSGRFSPLEIKILRTLSGPQNLSYSGEVVESTRGTLMGLPTSWCLLSIIHLWWIDEVNRTSPSGPLRRAHKSSICGDDALLATTSAGALRYRQCVQLSGGEPSPGKHYECCVGLTRRGVFLEKLFEWGVVDGKLSSGTRFPAIPVKGLTSQSLPREFTGAAPIRCGSRGIIQIMVLDSLASQNECLMAPLKDYVSRRVSWLNSYATEVIGLAPGHPLKYGGYFLGKKTEDSEKLAQLVKSSGTNFSIAARLTLDSCWKMASGYSDEGRAFAIGDGEIVDCGFFQPLAFDVEGPVRLGQIRLPTDRAYTIHKESDREEATTNGMYLQTRVFSPPTSSVFNVRAKALAATLKKLRRIGSLRPRWFAGGGADLLIAWRTPSEEESQSNGTSWLDADSTTTCHLCITAVTEAGGYHYVKTHRPKGRLPQSRGLQDFTVPGALPS